MTILEVSIVSLLDNAPNYLNRKIIFDSKVDVVTINFLLQGSVTGKAKPTEVRAMSLNHGQFWVGDDQGNVRRLW